MGELRLRCALRSYCASNELGNGIDVERLRSAALHRFVVDGQRHGAQNASVDHRQMRLPIDAADIVACQCRKFRHDVGGPAGILIGVPQIENVRQPQIVIIGVGQKQRDDGECIAIFAGVEWIDLREDFVHDLLRGAGREIAVYQIWIGIRNETRSEKFVGCLR